MHPFIRSICHGAFIASLATAFPAAAQAPAATGYPTAPIRMVVPFPAGGGVDSMGRIVAQRLGDALGRPVVVDNRGGANGMIGSELVAKGPKDGYTLVRGAGVDEKVWRRTVHDGIADGNESPLAGCGVFNGLNSPHPRPAAGDTSDDDNGDGIPAPPMGSDTADDGPSSDTDNDAVIDGYECARGSNPRDPLSGLERPPSRKRLSCAEAGLLQFLGRRRRRSATA